MESKIGISLACYLPPSAWFTERTIRWALTDGYDFVDLLPFRGAEKNLYACTPVGYIEDAWNPVVSLRQALKNEPIGKEGLTPKPHDWLFFPCPKECEEIFVWLTSTFSQAQVGVHFTDDFAPGRLLEVNPRLMMTADRVVAWAIENKASLVADTYHLRRPLLTTNGMGENRVIEIQGTSEAKLGDWRDSIPKLLRFTKLIHVQPYRGGDEIAQIMAGEGQKTELAEMLRLIHESGYTGDYLVEGSIGLRGFNVFQLRRVMRKMHQFVADIIY